PETSWNKRTERDLLDELDDILTRSIRSRMVSDVPLGAFLSGGIDSSIVVAIMTKLSSQPIKTFTIGFNEKKYDESFHAKKVSEYLGTEHYTEILQVDTLLELMPVFVEEYDEPFFDYAAFPMMAVSRLAKRHVTVALSGDGGDELFGGYHYYKIAKYLKPFFSMPIIFRKALSSIVSLSNKHQLKLLAGALNQEDDIASFTFIRSIAKDFNTTLLPEIISKTKSMNDLFNRTSSFFPAGICASEKGMRLDLQYTLPDDYLQKVDVASMSFSIEARVPMLDHSIVEWSMRLPVKWKIRKNINKYLLRKLAYRYIPKEILNRPKQGFGVPVNNWLRGPLMKQVEQRFNDSTLFKHLPLDQNNVIKLWELHLNRDRNVHPLLWAILMLLEFTDKHIIEK
ncbi:asparagine synthetase B family protein, partial [Thermodesulfobacteriota bacterium]